MSKTLGPVALKLGDEVLVKVRTNTTIKDLLEQLDKACKGGRIQDADGFDVTAHYSQDIPEGEYAIKHPTSGGPIAAAVRVVVSSMHANLLMVSRHLIVVKGQWSFTETIPCYVCFAGCLCCALSLMNYYMQLMFRQCSNHS